MPLLLSLLLTACSFPTPPCQVACRLSPSPPPDLRGHRRAKPRRVRVPRVGSNSFAAASISASISASVATVAAIAAQLAATTGSGAAPIEHFLPWAVKFFFALDFMPLKVAPHLHAKCTWQHCVAKPACCQGRGRVHTRQPLHEASWRQARALDTPPPELT